MQPKVSIIIPCYNVEKYVIDSLDSVVNQTLDEIEILLIDDGSTDHTRTVLESYARKDSRIHVLKQENKGPSAARNNGVKHASGEYIMFVDSDDMIVTNAAEVLYKEASNKQLEVLMGAYLLEKDGVTTQIDNPCKLNGDIVSGLEYTSRLIENRYIHSLVWLCIYNRKFIIEQQLYFYEGILHEDELWIPQVFLKANRVSQINFYFYKYRVRPNSIMTAKKKSKNSEDIKFVVQELYQLYQTLPIEYHPRFNDYLCMLYMNALYINDDQNGNKKFMRETANSFRNRFKAILYSISPKLYLNINHFIKK